jgi:hypothetical protein
MIQPTPNGSVWSTLSLVFYGVLWFKLILYFSGVMDVQRYGGVYALALFAATLIATFTSPYRASPRWHDAATLNRPVQPPRLLTYVGMAGMVFVLVWLLARIMEWISLSLTGAARWPVSNLSGVLVVAAVAVISTSVFALMHVRLYRQHTRSANQG